MKLLKSRDNPRVRRWTRLAQDSRFRHAERRALLEGSHLVQACLSHGFVPVVLITSESGLQKAEIASLVDRAELEPVLLPDSLFRSVLDVESPAGIAAEIALPEIEPDLTASESCVFLDGIQDPGNVGAILRSAGAFGIRDLVLGRGCADPWSPKALRAAMGAHFGMRITAHADLEEAMDRFAGRPVCAVPSQGVPLPEADLCGRLGWIFGAEGQGVSAGLVRRAALRVSIPMAPGSESLNVAAAAAICFYEMRRRRTASASTCADGSSARAG
jgi:RNA methyltransferase, TrmH family